MKNIIWLAGFMGTGKSSVGKELARRIGCKFTDSDAVIVERAGKSIPEIFSQDGEPRFRDFESEAIRDLSESTEPLVVALGGGAVLREENRAVMKETGTVALLKASTGTILKRVGDDPNRPLFPGKDNRQAVNELLEIRRSAYEAAADFAVDTDTLSPKEVAEEVLKRSSARKT